MELNEELTGALEAILMVASAPIPTDKLSAVLGTSEATIDHHLRELQRQYRDDQRGFELRQTDGWRFYSAPQYADVVASFVTWGQSAKLSGPALETLAAIAYRQPVTRSQVAQIRGVAVDGVVRTLETRGLIEVVGTTESGAVLYGTTRYFLERMGIADLAELPEAAPHLPELDQLEDVEKQA